MKVQEVEWSWDQPIVQDLLLRYYQEFLFSSPERAEADVDRVLDATGVTPPAAVLDIGCGLGYHAVAFARRGFDVKAFDPGERYLALARKQAQEAGVSVGFQCMPCADLAEDARFALAWAGSYCPGALTHEEVQEDFRRIRNALVPGGWFVSTVAGKSRRPASEKERNWGENDDCFVLSEKWSDGECHHEHCWFVYPEEGKIIKVVEVERMYGREDILPLLEGAGFTEIETWKSLEDREAPGEAGYFALRCRWPGSSFEESISSGSRGA